MALVGENGRKFSKHGESLYKELELPKEATEAEINRQYRKLALRFHPDKNPGNDASLEKFKQINRAHKVLIDPRKRKIYDVHGSLGLFVAEQTGEEPDRINVILSTWWCRSFICIGAILTGCYCCHCCCWCCGKCLPPEEDPHNFETFEEEGWEQQRSSNSTTTQQPSSNFEEIYIIPMPPMDD